MTDYVEEATKIIVEAAGPQHPENWSKFEYALHDLVIGAAAELEQQREAIRQAYIDIAESPCGKPDSQWTDFVNISAEDAWQIAFSAGLMAANARVKTLLPTKYGG